MKNLIIAAVGMAVTLLLGVSIAQSESRPSAEHRKLRRMAGTWTWTGEQVDIDADSPFGQAGTFSGKASRRIILNGLYLKHEWEEMGPAGLNQGTAITHYDPEKGVYVTHDFMGDGTVSTGTFTFKGRVRSDSISFPSMSGDPLLAKVEETFSDDWKRSESVWQYSVDNGKTWRHWATISAKKLARKPVSQEDFEELCTLFKGAWVGESMLREDIPGVGKKGERATAHYDYTIIEDGVALLGKSYWPGGTHTWLVAYDVAHKRIKTMGISAVFGIAPATLEYSDRTWKIPDSNRTFPDGSKVNVSVTGTFSHKGDTMTVRVKGTERSGEASDFTEVWQRVNR